MVEWARSKHIYSLTAEEIFNMPQSFINNIGSPDGCPKSQKVVSTASGFLIPALAIELRFLSSLWAWLRTATT